jgi:hypothetical protein
MSALAEIDIDALTLASGAAVIVTGGGAAAAGGGTGATAGGGFRHPTVTLDNTNATTAIRVQPELTDAHRIDSAW